MLFQGGLFQDYNYNYDYYLIYWGVSYTHRVPIKAAPAGVRHGLKGRKHAQIHDSHVFTA